MVKKEYAPDSLGKKEQAKQKKAIKKSQEDYKKGKYTDRPKVKNYKSKRSSHVVAFEKKYGTKITNKSFIYKNIISKAGVDKILSKGRGAFYSAGSKPNQTPSSWSNARLASVIMGGNARKVDKDIWNKYKK